MTLDLTALGWNEHFAQAAARHVADGLEPARVVSEHKHAYELVSAGGELTGELLGRLLKGGARSALPAVGDWVMVERIPGANDRAKIHAVLPRRTCFSRRAAGEKIEEQVIAANLDTVFLVNGLDADFNPRRIERYLALARGSGAEPVILLNKADLCAEAAERVAEIRALAGGATVLALSAVRGDGVEALRPWLGRGRTVALLGSSGVGKSTIANALLGEERQETGEVREHDSRGKHTTTRREIIPLPGGALLVDTPGMRELQLWDNAREGLTAAFPDVLELAGGCRFRDCRHEAEPGCAVRGAIACGTLEPARFASYLKLRAELEVREAGAAKSLGRPRGRRIMRAGGRSLPPPG
ncbi:MAG: ribosome small subunit-dependent GTPase A, partial [Opitutaceae bacterium]|nr:ribosome small subunit-dependent GTPase A [Opitutaceae bacterium]